MLRRALLVCGILSSLVNIVADIVASRLYAGYSYTDQTVSELSAIGAPTRPLWVVTGIIYTLLFCAFGWGVWLSAGRNRAVKFVGGLVIAHGFIGLFWPPMHPRGTEFTLTDTLHIVWTIVSVLLMLVAMGIAAAVLGKRFRIYSIASMLIMLAFGALTGVNAPGVAANLPTPWTGIRERICIAASLLWVIVLAIMLWRGARDASFNKKSARGQTARDVAVNGFVRPDECHENLTGCANFLAGPSPV